MAKAKEIKRVIISRTDAIGDVILTLPLCGLLKKHFPNVFIIFLGKTYTKPIIDCCENIDEFLNADELLSHNEKDAIDALKKLNADCIIHVFPNKKIARLSQKAKIPNRIGTTNRIFHWGVLNNLVALSRKNSTLHESQLNLKLLQGLGINDELNLIETAELIGFNNTPKINEEQKSILSQDKINVILHPKSNASAREWSLENYKQLITLLNPKKYNVFISGTTKEKELLEDWFADLPSHVIDLTGKYNLIEFIAFISECDYLVAASTGPLHIAAACGIGAIGIYPPIKPMHPGRWQPIGKKAKHLCINKSCNACKKLPNSCYCINEITAQMVAKLLN